MAKEYFLTIVRHGETKANRSETREVQGITDGPLNDVGRAQAKKCGQSLKHEMFTAAFSSPLSRAFETGQIILEENNHLEASALTKLDLLIEQDLGIFEGRPGQEYFAAMKLAATKAGGKVSWTDFEPEGGEPNAKFAERGEQVWQPIFEAVESSSSPVPHLLITVHGGIFSAMVKGLIKNYEVSSAPAPLEGEFAGFYYMGNTGIARFKGNIGSKEVQCLGINDMKHLEEEKNVAA